MTLILFLRKTDVQKMETVYCVCITVGQKTQKKENSHSPDKEFPPVFWE